MEIEIINSRTNLSVNLSSYVNPSGILINKFDSGKVAANFNKIKLSDKTDTHYYQQL